MDFPELMIEVKTQADRMRGQCPCGYDVEDWEQEGYLVAWQQTNRGQEQAEFKDVKKEAWKTLCSSEARDRLWTRVSLSILNFEVKGTVMSAADEAAVKDYAEHLLRKKKLAERGARDGHRGRGYATIQGATWVRIEDRPKSPPKKAKRAKKRKPKA